MAVAKAIAPNRKNNRKKPQRKPPAVASAKPLPPPVPVSGAAEQPASKPSLFGLDQLFPSNSHPQSAEELPLASEISSVSEPRPGEPLGPDAERILRDVPETIGDASRGPSQLNDEESVAAIGAMAAIDPAFLQGLISFDESDVRSVLEEGFEFLADKFDSDHWKLTERQSRMLGRPTAQLLSTLWTKLSFLLPAQLAQWCASTPGLAGFVLTSAIVLSPKVAQQVSVSRKRRAAPNQPRQPGPVPVAPRRDGPIGPIDTSAAQPIPTNHDYE